MRVGADPLAGHETYKTVKRLSSGTYGIVCLAEDRTNGEQFALKFIPRGTIATNYVRREIINHMKLRHPHVVALHEVFLTQDHLVIVMEYARGGDLFRYVRERRGLPESEGRWFFRQIVAALDYCHRMGVCLRDIKLENTLLDTPNSNGALSGTRPLVKLCDFGFSKHAETDSAPGSKVGTPAYLAPEVITVPQGGGSGGGGMDDQPNTYDGPAADVWSLGVLLYTTVCGAYPFRAGDDEVPSAARLDAQFRRIMAVDYAFPASIQNGQPLSESFKDLVRRMLVRVPSQRATLRHVMQHPWFCEGLNAEHWARVMKSNDEMVAYSQNNPLPDDLVAEITVLVEEAGRTQQYIARNGGGGGGGGGQQDGGVGNKGGKKDLDAYQDDVDAMLEGGTSHSTSHAATSAFLEQI